MDYASRGTVPAQIGSQGRDREGVRCPVRRPDTEHRQFIEEASTMFHRFMAQSQSASSRRGAGLALSAATLAAGLAVGAGVIHFRQTRTATPAPTSRVGPS